LCVFIRENFNARILGTDSWGEASRALGITIARHYGIQMYVCTASMRFEASIKDVERSFEGYSRQAKIS
jgi:hypothetical protein